MRNMKIKVEINEQGESTLDEIVGELERLGFHQEEEFKPEIHRFVHANNMGFDFWHTDMNWGELTTLAELRSMNIETLKEM